MKLSIDFDPTLSPSAKRALRWIALPIAVFLGAASIAHATLTPDPASWIGAGKPVSAMSPSSDLTQLDSRLAAVETKYRFQGYAQQCGSGLPSGTDATWIDYSTVPATASGSCVGASLFENGGGPTAALMLTDGVSFTPPHAGLYKVTVSFGAAATPVINVSFKLSDGTADVGTSPIHVSPAIVISVAPADAVTAFLPGIIVWDYELPAAPVTLRLQYQRSSSSLQLYGDTVFTIEEL